MFSMLLAPVYHQFIIRVRPYLAVRLFLCHNYLMVIERTLAIPADHQLHVTVPPEFPAGENATVIVFAPDDVKPAAPHTGTRIGFLKGRISVPADFDTMGQKEISALFTGTP
jgi:hypothetical protein